MTRHFILILMMQLLLGQVAIAQDKPVETSIDDLIEQLDNVSFPKRQAATNALVAKGAAAIDAVTKAAEGQSLEVTVRCIQVLSELAVSANAKDSSRAMDSLKNLTKSKKFVVALRATRAIGAFSGVVAKKLLKIKAKIFRENGVVVRVNFNRETTTNEHLALIRHLPTVKKVSVAYTKVDAGGLKHLIGLPQIYYLNCYGSQVGDDALQHTLKMPGLRALPLGETKVTDAGLKTLGKHINLTYIGFRKMAISDKGVAELKNLTNLSTLYLGETDVTDASIPHLANMTRLETLRLHKTGVTDKGVKQLHGFTKLKELSLYGTDVSPEAMADLKTAIRRIKIVTKEPQSPQPTRRSTS